MNNTEKQILHIKEEIETLKLQTKNKITELEFEIIKLQNPTLTEYVDKNFTNKCFHFHFDDKIFGRNYFTLQNKFGVKILSIPVEIKYIDNNIIEIVGLKENFDSEKTELFNELNRLTNNIFPLKATVVNTYCELGEKFNYGIIEDNILSIKTVFLANKYEKENIIRVYHKSDTYKCKW